LLPIILLLRVVARCTLASFSCSAMITVQIFARSSSLHGVKNPRRQISECDHQWLCFKRRRASRQDRLPRRFRAGVGGEFPNHAAMGV
jgi:hypothetical protein